MCVAAIAWDAHPDWLLVVAGNRDEYHARPAAPISRWADGSDILAGTDLTGGGTWLGLTEAGRFALVTNFRVPQGPQPGRPSRGRLVTDLLIDAAPADMSSMNPFNLVLVEHASQKYEAWFLTNFPALERRPLTAGIHGLSNGGFDVPWRKTVRIQDRIAAWIATNDADPEPLLAALRDETPPAGTATDAEWQAGTGPEPRFSPVFIADPVYGTRCSTVVTVNRTGEGLLVERSFDPAGRVTGEERLSFRWPETQLPDQAAIN